MQVPVLTTLALLAWNIAEILQAVERLGRDSFE